jgi:hypothetical protein
MNETRHVWRWGLTLAGLAFLLQFIVIWSVHYPPQVDIPNHMARHYLESRYLFGEELPPYYEIDYRVLPNLGADLVVPFLLRFLEPLAACKLFLSLAAMLYWLGPAWFIWQQGEYQPSALLASLLLLPLNMSGTFFWGFLNYYSGLGLAFLALVHFDFLCRQPNLRFSGLFVHTGLVTLLFFWHLAPLAIYGVLMSCHVLVDVWQRRQDGSPFGKCLLRGVLLMAPMVPALVLFGVYNDAKADLAPSPSHWGGWANKLRRPSGLFRTYNEWIDLTVLGLWMGTLLAFFGYRMCTARKSWLCLGIGALLAAYLIMPFDWGSTSSADTRLLPAIMICALALVGTIRPKRFWLGAGLLAIGLLLRYGAVFLAWHRLDDRLMEEAKGFDHIPPHSRIMPLILAPILSKEVPERHFLSWLAIYNEAFVPTLFQQRDQFTLHIHEETRVFAHQEAGMLWIDEEQTRAHYDFVWLYNPQDRPVRMPTSFTKIFSAGGATLWSVKGENTSAPSAVADPGADINHR